MRTLKPTQTWILICLLTVVSSGTIEHAPPHHDATQHGESTVQKKTQNTIVPFGIQIPEHVLSTQDVACISADDNIFQIMNEAQRTCNGTDMACTFYHFVNHGYENIGTLDVNKKLFDDLLMKFDNWLLTAENIDKDGVHGKTKEGYSVDTASINVNDRYRNEGNIANTFNASNANGQTNQGTLDQKSNDDRIHGQHVKNLDETHHKNHHHKLKNENQIKLDTKYNDQHRYFEVFLPKDKETGKPRTIYVEVDRDKNEFVLLDEDIDKKLNGIEPIKIELDELSEVADTAFSDIVKHSYHKGLIYNHLEDNDRDITSNFNINTAVDNHEIHVGADADELTHNILSSSVCNPNICNINANQQLISNNTTGNVKKVINVSKNLIVPNKYFNQAQYHIESHTNNTANIISNPNNNFEIVQNINETDLYGKVHFNTIEFDQNNVTELDKKSEENSSLEFIKIPCETENNNCTENNEFSDDNENITYDDNDFTQLVENNETSNDINFDETDPIHLKDLMLVDKENKLKSTPDIFVKSSSVTSGMSDNTYESNLHLIPSENHEEHTELDQTHSLVSSKPISLYSTVPILGKDLAKVVEMDSNLQSSFPVYATVDLLASESQNNPGHPSLTSYNPPLDSVHGQQTIGSKISQYISPKFPFSPVECATGLNKGSKYSFLPSSPPLNFGLYSPIEQLGTPFAAKSLGSTSSPQNCILPITQSSKEFSGSPEAISPDHMIPVKGPRLFPNLPALSYDIQKPCLVKSPLHSDADTLTSPKHVLPTEVDFPSTTPLTAMPYKPTEVGNSPCPFQPTPSYLQPSKDNLGFSNSPFENNFKDTIVPCSGNKNKYPCNIMPYFLNPYLIPTYFNPQPCETRLQPTPKISTFDSPSISLDQSNLCVNTDYPREMQPMPLFPFAPNTQFLPLNSPWRGSGFIPNTCPSLWNNIAYQNIPSLPYSDIPIQNMWNYPSFNNYLAPPMEVQQSQFLKPLPTKEAAKSVPEFSYNTKNILQMTPLTQVPLSSVYPRPAQMDLSPSLSLERDLQTLSCKYGIPLTKILDSLEAEIFDTHSKSSSPFETPWSTLKQGSSIKGKSTSSTTNAGISNENRSGNEEILLESDLANFIPLDSSLIGPHLDIDDADLLGSNDNQTYTIASEFTEPLNEHLSLKKESKQNSQDSSLIGSQLSTLSTGTFQLSDEDRIENAEVYLESDTSSLIPLDSSLIGPHLEISPSVELDSDKSQGTIVTSHTEIPGILSSQIKTKLNIQNQPAKFSLDGSLKGSHLATLSKAKPLFSSEIQSINDMIPLQSDLTELTPLDSFHADVVNELEQSESLQHEKAAETLSDTTDSTNLSKSVETKQTEDKFLHFDSSLIGPHLQTGSSNIQTSSVEQKVIPEIFQGSLQNANELENIILPPSMLPTLLQNAVTVDLNPNIQDVSQDVPLNEERSELSLVTNADLPITHIAPMSLKETDFQILEPTIGQPDTVKHKLTSPVITNVADSELQLDRYFQDPRSHHEIKTTKISSNLDSSIQLDNSLIGPSILHEIDSPEMIPMLDSVDNAKSSIGAVFADQIKKPFTVSAAIDSETEHDSSLADSGLHKEINYHEFSTPSNFDTQLDKSLIVPNLLETIESLATSSVSETNSKLQNSTKDHGLISETETIDVSRAFDPKNTLDTSLVGPHLSTASFSTDEIKMINKELQLESDQVHLKPFDSSLVGSQFDLESQFDESEISRYQDPELLSLVEEESSVQPNAVSTINPSDLQDLLSKFTHAITKSHLLPSEVNPCDKLLSLKGKTSSVSKNVPFEDLHTYTQLSSQDELTSELSPMTVSDQNFLPVESNAKGQSCINSNYFPTPVTFPQYVYSKEAPRIPTMSSSPFLQMKPLIPHNWQGSPLNIQNILQGSPELRPVAEKYPIPLISNTFESLSPEELKLLLDLASQSNLYPQSSNLNMFRPGKAIATSSEWTIPSQILPADKYIPLLPKKSPIVLPSNLESTVCDTEYNPVVHDDIMSLINENSYQKLKDTPYSQSFVPPSISEFEKDDIHTPSLLDYVQTTPMFSNPLKNAMIPSSIYNPQNIQTPYIPPYNLQPYPYLPEEKQFSEIIEPALKLISLPNKSPKLFLESEWHDMSNNPQFLEYAGNPLLESELQQLLSKPCLDSPVVLPNLLLEAMLQLPSNELINTPCQSTPLYYPELSPIYSTQLSNAIASPILSSYASPLPVSPAKLISKPSSNLLLVLPLAASPITAPTLSMNPYANSPFTSEFSSPHLPVKTELSDYTYLPTLVQNRPTLSAVPFKPCHTYSSPYLPVQPSPLPMDTTPHSPFINKLRPTIIYSPAYSQAISATQPHRPAPKSLGDLIYPDTRTLVSASPTAPTHTGILSPSPDTSFNYTPFPKTNTRPSSCLAPAYLTPISQESPDFPMNIRYLKSNSISSTIPQIINQELQPVRPMSIQPVPYGNNQLSNANKMLPISPNIPIPSYSTLVSKLSPCSQIKQNIACGKCIQSNLLTSPLTEEEPFYNVIEENMNTHSNVRDKYYQETSFNYLLLPLESMSYTLAPEEITETFPDEDLVKSTNFVTSPMTSLASEPSLQTTLYERPFLTPYTSLSGKPCPAPLSLTELQQNIFDTISLMPLSNPLKYPASQPISILSNPLLKPLKPFTPAPNPPILPSPCMHTSLNPFNMLPLSKQPLLSSPYYSTCSQHIATPIDPRALKEFKDISPALLQVPMNTPLTPVSPITLSQPPSLPVIPNNFILLSPSSDPKSFVKSLSFSDYNKYSAPIISPVEETIPLSSAQNFNKITHKFSPQYMSSNIQAPTTFQNSIPVYETPIRYQPFIPPTGLVSSAKNIFLNPVVTSQNTESSTFNNIVEPLHTDFSKPKWSSSTPKYSLPAPLSSPVPLNPTLPLSSCFPVNTQKTASLAFTNHIIPSSLFTIPDTKLLSTYSQKISPPHNIPKYSWPSIVEPLQIVPDEIQNSPLGSTVLPQNILKPYRQFSSAQFKPPTVSQPLQPIDSYTAQPTNIQYSSKSQPKLSPVSSQYVTPTSAPSFTPLPLEIVPNRLINKPYYGLQSVPIYDTTIHTSFSGKNPFLNPNFKPIPEVPSYSVSNKLVSSPKMSPFYSIISPNLRPVDISQNPFESYSQITSLPPLPSSLAKTMSQKSRLNQPDIIPINSQFESPIESNPLLLPSTCPILNTPLLKSLVTNSQNIAPSLPMHLSRLNTVTPESTPTSYIPSVTGNYLFPHPSTSLLSEIPKTGEQLNLLPTTPLKLFKSRLNKLQETPVTKANMPLYSNYDIVKTSSEPSMTPNIVNIAKPIEVSALDSSFLSRDSFDPEIIEEIEPAHDAEYKLSPLLINLIQQRQFNPDYTSIPKPSSKYQTSKPIPSFSSSLIPEDVEIIDATDFSPLSQIKSEPFTTDYSSTDRQASIITNIPTPTDPDILKFSPYSTILNTKPTSSIYMKLLPKLQAKCYSNKFSRLPPLFLSPQEQKELIQGSTISDGSSSTSSSSNFLTSTNTEPQLISSQLIGRPCPVTLYTSPISSNLGSWLQSPTLEKYLPSHVKVTPENIQTLLNKHRLFDKIGVNEYPNELISSIPEVFLEQNTVKPRLIKSGPNTEYEHNYSNDFNEYDSQNMPHDEEFESISVDENRLGTIEGKSLTETLPEIVKDLNIPCYNEVTQTPQRLSKLDHFYANNHIGQSPQVFTVPAYKTLLTDNKSSFTTISPQNFKELTNTPAKLFGVMPKLDAASQMRPDDYYPENQNSPINVPITNSHPQTYLDPYLKPYAQRKFPPSAIEMAGISEMPYQPTSSTPDSKIDNIKYSGYKTYKIPSIKSPKLTEYLGTPTLMNGPPVATYSTPILAPKHSEIQQNPSYSPLYRPTEIYELHNTQSQTQADVLTPLQTKLGLDTLQENPKLNEYDPLISQYQTPVDIITPLQSKSEPKTLRESPDYDDYSPIEDVPVSVYNINEDNELKTSLINYINNREDDKNKLDNNDGELTIPIGNIAITKKDPYNSETIETNNPSIGLKVWKSNVKIAQAELKLKFKDLSVNNFMPVVNNVDKYDVEEIRKIVKNYIDEKYGAHIEVNVPYTIDNKYSIINDFDHDAVENKYNLLWPTHYV